MFSKPAFWATLVAALAVGVACGAAGSPTQAPPEPLIPAPGQEGQPQPDAQPPDQANAEPQAEEVQSAPAQPIPGRPTAPAPVDGDFRPDPASVVAATGNPQLIEFFAFW